MSGERRGERVCVDMAQETAKVSDKPDGIRQVRREGGDNPRKSGTDPKTRREGTPGTERIVMYYWPSSLLRDVWIFRSFSLLNDCLDVSRRDP